MTQQRRKFTRITSPVGTAVFPKLSTPDTKYKALGEYATKLVLSGDDSAPIIEKFEAELAAYFEEVKAELMKGDGKSKAKAKSLKFAADKPFKPEVDDEGDETGNFVFNFKMPARIAREGKPDLVLKPDVFDAAGKKLTSPPDIWGGSRLKVAFELRPFNTAIGVGMSLRLNAVQVIELRSAGQRDAAGYGFGAEEGYAGADETPAFGNETTGSDTGAGDADDNKDF
jgi:hypothetical protein